MKYIKNALIFFLSEENTWKLKVQKEEKNEKNRRQRWCQILAGSQYIRKILQIGNTVC